MERGYGLKGCGKSKKKILGTKGRAVQRNKIKRTIREALRLSNIKGWFLIHVYNFSSSDKIEFSQNLVSTIGALKTRRLKPDF